MSGTEAVNAAPAEAPADAAPATESVATPAAPVTEAPATPAEPDDYSDLAGLDPKWAKEVRDLRKENAKRRTDLKQYESAFEPYGQEERDVWLGLAQLTAVDPRKGAKALADLSKALEEGLSPEEAADAAGIPTPDEDQPLTRKQLDDYMAEQKKELEIASAAAEIEKKATAAGYKVGTTEYKLLLTRAMDMNYDLDAAIKAEKADIQTKAEALIAEKLASGEKWPITPAQGGSGSPSGEVQHDGSWDRAEKGLRARIAASRGK